MHLFKTSGFLLFIGLLSSTAVTAQQTINLAGSSEDDRLGMAVITGDFNCDGYADLAAGAPVENDSIGAINVVYGGTGTGSQLGSADNSVFTGSDFFPDNLLRFGEHLAAGDFDSDNCDDLVVGVPDADAGADFSAGKVLVMYGSLSGISSGNIEFWYQDSPGVLGGTEEDDRFGWAVAVGDFNNDNRDDLAIGAPGEAIGSISAGSVSILYGASGGLTATGNQLFHQDSTGILETAEQGDRFGASLAAGDFDGNGYDDLAIGVPNEKVGSVQNAGGVQVLYSYSTAGLSATNNQWWDQNSWGVAENPAAGNLFGFSLAAGHFNNDGRADLAIGVPRDYEVKGAVSIFHGSLSGLTPNNHLTAAGLNAPNSDIGDSLSVGDFNGDNVDDLVLGAPDAVFEVNVSGLIFPLLYGGVHILYNGVIPRTQFIHQDVAGVPDQGEHGDGFGYAVAAGDFDSDGADDLAVGVPFESTETVGWAGIVQVFYGDDSLPLVGGIVSANNQLLAQ